MANHWVVIPAGTKGSRCKGATCGKTIFFTEHPKSGKIHPYFCDMAEGKRPTETEPGRGVTHYADCVDVDRFRKGPSNTGRAR